jgi:dihydroflavonol-4-reductase
VGVTLVTGGTGFIGSHVARRLVERGDDVRLTVRARSKLENVAGLDVETIKCDILDRRALRRAFRGVDRVFHTAGFTSLRAPTEALWRINVDGTRIVLEEALRAGVERVVHTSSVAAIGPARRGSTADERQAFTAGRYGLADVNSKHAAEEIALGLVDQGLPVVVVNPAHVFGRGDVYRSSTDIVRRFLRREIPAYVDGAINIVDVDDVARGHLLADEQGVVGERYILGNRNFTFDRLFADLGRLSGVEPPALKLPLPIALAMTRTARVVLGGFPITETEVRAASMWWTVRSTKARRELGWRPSHHENTLVDTIGWYREREPLELLPPGARQPLPLRMAGYGLQVAKGLPGRLLPLG